MEDVRRERQPRGLAPRDDLGGGAVERKVAGRAGLRVLLDEVDGVAADALPGERPDRSPLR